MTALVVASAVVDKLVAGVPDTASTETGVVLAAYAVLLHRHTAQDRVAVGTSGGVPVVYDFESHRDFPALLASPRAVSAEPVSRLEITRTDDGWSLSAHPAADLLPPELADVMLTRFDEVLAALADDPTTDVADIAFRTEERPDTWRTNDLPFEPGTVIAAIEAQVARTPDAIAVELGDERLTYAAVDRRAGEVAAALSARTARPFVGVHMTRSPDMVVALLGVAKAGLAYVPIDPGSPSRRVRYVVDDAGLDLVLCRPEDVGALAALDVPAATLDGLTTGSARGDVRAPEPGSPIYMIYTSGSTGEPKGVVNRHAGVLNTIRWRQRAMPLSEEDRVVQKTPFTFDVSAWELFWPLTAGARLVLAEPGGHRDPRYVKRLIRDRGATVVHFVPSMLDVFLQEPDLASHCRTLRRVLCSGEALSPASAARFHEVLSCELHNLYGPTEASIEVSHWACPPGRAGAVPIGREIAGTDLHVVDARLRPLPVGAVGELCIGGVQVAYGYHGRAGLTADRFVPDPFAGRGARMYLTGDLARRRPDGEVEYLGRVDDQVKIRGFRVEPGEIEAALRALPGVDAAAVVPRDSPGGRQLVAFVVGDPGDVRTALGDVLPAHMVPAVVVPTTALPLGPSGKLDRRALAERADAVEATTHSTSPPTSRSTTQPTGQPTTATETTLCALFAETLGLPAVGVEDDFFALGGHSLTAVGLANRVNAVLGVEIDVWILFECPTVAALARELGR
ncbi:amino acid adenylation domain-containing protein [Saccharothrix isguenensis]